jgi:hypothetical protein
MGIRYQVAVDQGQIEASYRAHSGSDQRLHRPPRYRARTLSGPDPRASSRKIPESDRRIKRNAFAGVFTPYAALTYVTRSDNMLTRWSDGVGPNASALLLLDTKTLYDPRRATVTHVGTASVNVDGRTIATTHLRASYRSASRPAAPQRRALAVTGRAGSRKNDSDRPRRRSVPSRDLQIRPPLQSRVGDVANHHPRAHADW